MHLLRTTVLLTLLLLLPAAAQKAPPAPHTHDFGDIERWIKAFEDPARDEWQKPDLVVGLLGLKPGQNVADIGAGTGYFTRRLARVVSPGGIAVAVDIEPGFFPYIDQNAAKARQDNIFTRKAEADDPRLGAGIYDLIFICDTLHHIDHRAEYYAWLKRALRPGGRVVVVDFFKTMDIPVGPKPEMRLDPAALRAELVASGFTVSLDVETLPYQYILTATPRS